MKPWIRKILDIIQIPQNIYLMCVKWDRELAYDVLNLMKAMPEWRKKSISMQIIIYIGELRIKKFSS